MFEQFSQRPKNRSLAIALALIGAVTPVAGIHKLYLGQYLWGGIYLLLWATPIPRIACAIEAVWYVVQGTEDFQQRFNLGLGKTPTGQPAQDFTQYQEMAEALRQLEQLRNEGLLSEYEFEQKRRQILQ